MNIEKTIEYIFDEEMPRIARLSALWAIHNELMPAWYLKVSSEIWRREARVLYLRNQLEGTKAEYYRYVNKLKINPGEGIKEKIKKLKNEFNLACEDFRIFRKLWENGESLKLLMWIEIGEALDKMEQPEIVKPQYKNRLNADEVAERVNIVEIIGNYIQARRSGRYFKTVCPFHTEKTPSMVIYPETNSWYCFGCHKGGNIFHFIQEIEKCNFREALERVARMVGMGD